MSAASSAIRGCALAFATFMAAGVGNFFFHFMLEIRVIAEVGLVEHAGPLADLCLLLRGAGRRHRRLAAARAQSRMRARAGCAGNSCRRSASRCSSASCRSSTARSASWRWRSTSSSCSTSSESTDGSFRSDDDQGVPRGAARANTTITRRSAMRESLIKAGRLDSLAVVKLVTFLESAFDVDFDGGRVRPGTVRYGRRDSRR